MDSLAFPPFPALTWADYFWEADIVLPSWAGFQARRGDYGAVTSHRPADGTARLSIASLDHEARTPPTAEQVAAFQHLMDNEAAVAEAVVTTLVDYCPGNCYDGNDDELRAVSEPAHLRRFIGLSSVHITDVFHEGVACVGFDFGCVWDEEHGAGVMTYLGRVLATGQGDTSFEAWVARQGLEKRLGVKFPRPKKPRRKPGSSK